MAEKSKKLANFERLGEKRVSEAVKRIRLIGNLSNRNNYEFTEQHVRQIFDALEGAIKEAKEAFRPKSPLDTDKFRFKG